MVISSSNNKQPGVNIRLQLEIPKMGHPLSLLMLALCVSAAFSFSIDCISAGVSFCSDNPVECKVSLDEDLCVAGVDIFSKSDLTVTLTDSSTGSFNPSYNLTQNNSAVTIVTDYVPSSNLSEITVNMEGNLTSYCTFNLTFTDSVQRTVTLCNNDSLSLELFASSSSSTDENSLAINEVFQILLELTVPLGETYFHAETTITAQEDDDIPVEILDIKEIIPVSVSTNGSVEELDELEINWNLGQVLNTNDSAAVVRLLYTAVVLDQNVLDLILQFSATLYADGVMVSTATEITATLVMPLLNVYKSFSVVVDTGDSLVFEVTTVVSHDNTSTGPAFRVKIHELVPAIFEVILPFFLETDGDRRSLNRYKLLGDMTFLEARIRKVQLQSKVTMTYLAHFKPFRHFDEITIGVVAVNYSTIIQEGIGLLYNFPSESRSTYTDVCFNKMVDIHKYTDESDVAIIVPLFSGVFLVAAIIVIVVIIHCFIRRVKVRERVAPSSSAQRAAPSLVAAVIGQNKKENEEHLIFKNKKRPLFSSLLDALPKKTWNERDDVHECREADYIAEAEGSLLYAKGQMITYLFKHFLQSKTALSKEDIMKNTDVFKLKVNILQKTLQESVKSQLENAALQYGADKILKEGEQDSKHQEDDTTIAEAIPKSRLSNFSEVVQHIREQNVQEKGDALDLIEITAKREKIQIIRQHTINYLLGLKAIVSNVLHEAAVYNKDEIIRELYCALEHGEKIIHRENDKLNEMADTRGRRQKLVLLDKKLVEEADERWVMLLQNQIERSITELISCQVLPAESRNVARKELEQILLKEFRAEMASRLQEEMRLNRAAKEELGNLERQLSKSSKRHYYTDYKQMLETEFQKWHDKQKMKEEALKQVEDKVHNELKKTWDTWIKKHDGILFNFTLHLTPQLQARGLQPYQCTSLMQEYAKSREELEGAIKTSRLVQKARFQARVNQHLERSNTLMEQSDSLFKKKMEVERKHLEKIKEAFSNMKHGDPRVFEEYSDDVNKLEGSLSVEKLNIHINLKEKFTERRKNTFQFIFHEFLERKDEKRDEEELKMFLEKRRDAVFEMCTRSYEEERKKAEEEITQAKDKILSSKKPSAVKAHTPVQVKAGPSRVQLATEPAEIQDETKMLLDSHKQDLAKLSNKLEDDRKKAMLALEQKMIQKRIRREKAVEQLMKPDWSQYRGSKFKELVQKQILSTRVEKIRKQNAESLSDAMDALQKEFDGKKQDAKEKLEKKLEAHLVESGKASSEQLVEVFEELHRTELTSDTVISESAADPLLANRSKRGVLPPITA